MAAKSGDDVVRTQCFDMISNSYKSIKWPAPFDSSGVLRNEVTKQWDGSTERLEKALDSDEKSSIIEKFKRAEEEKDPSGAIVYSGKGVGKIRSIDPAFEIMTRIEKEAINAISGLAKVLPKE